MDSALYGDRFREPIQTVKFCLKKCPQTKIEMKMRQNNFEIYILFIIWRSYSQKKEYATNFFFCICARLRTKTNGQPNGLKLNSVGG